MKPIAPIIATTAVASKNKPGSSLHWQAGQVLSGKVMQGEGAEKYLRIGRHDFAAQGLGKLPAGKALKLEVLRGGDLPVLRLLENNPASQILNNQRLLDLPRQASLLKLTGLLSAINLNKSELPADVKTLASQLLTKLPKVLQAQQSAELKALIQNSGLSLEHRLGQPGALEPKALQPDIKAILLIFQSELKRLLNANKSARKKLSSSNTPPPNRHASLTIQTPPSETGKFDFSDLLDATTSVLARHRLNQLESLPREGESSRVWLMEIPLVEKEKTNLLQLRIKQHTPEENNTSSEAWTIELAIAPEPLGPIHAKLKLNNDNLSLTIWAEKVFTENIFQQHKEHLLSRFRVTGISPEQVHIFQGKPPEKTRTEKTPSLLDQQA